MIEKLGIYKSSKASVHMLQILLEIMIIISLEELGYLNCLCYPEDYPYAEGNLNSIKSLLVNLLFSQSKKLDIQNIQQTGRKIFKFDMDYTFFLEQLTTRNEESKKLVVKEQYLNEIEPM